MLLYGTGGIQNFGGLQKIDELCFFAKESIKILNVCPPNQLRKCYRTLCLATVGPTDIIFIGLAVNRNLMR